MPNQNHQTIPVVLFAHARPRHLEKVLEGLRNNRVPLLYIYCDARRSSELEAAAKQVKDLIESITWCDVRKSYRSKNLGLGKNIRSGVSEVLDAHESAIIVEDDIVFRDGAYDYTCAAAREYLPDDRVMTISMWTDPAITPPDCIDGFFSERFVCWGWATNRVSWQKHQGTPKQILEQCRKAGRHFERWGNDLRLMAEIAEKRNLWYAGYALTHFLHNGLSYFPPVSLVDNIGNDGSGENCHASPIAPPPATRIAAPIQDHFPPIEPPAPGLAQLFYDYFHWKQPNLYERARIATGKYLRAIRNSASRT